jgi:hypothetical protein
MNTVITLLVTLNEIWGRALNEHSTLLHTPYMICFCVLK